MMKYGMMLLLAWGSLALLSACEEHRDVRRDGYYERPVVIHDDDGRHERHYDRDDHRDRYDDDHRMDRR